MLAVEGLLRESFTLGTCEVQGLAAVATLQPRTALPFPSWAALNTCSQMSNCLSDCFQAFNIHLCPMKVFLIWVFKHLVYTAFFLPVIFKLPHYAWIGDEGLKEGKNSE